MQRASFILFVAVLIFCPLAFGTVEYWSTAVLETASAAACILLCVSWYRTGQAPLKVPGFAPLFLLLLFMLIQLIPLPAALVRFLSPAAYDLYSPVMTMEPKLHFIPLTVNRKETLLMLFTFSSCALVYLLTIYHCRAAAFLKKTLAVVVVLAVLIAVEAILQKLTSPGHIYWFRPTPNSSPVGPWVYSNHFAGFMEMLFPVVIALLLFYRPQVSYGKTLRERFVLALTMPGANTYLLLKTGAVLIGVSIFLSLSRGGILTLCLAFLFFIVLAARSSQDKRTRWAILLSVFIILMVSWLGWQPIIDKFGNLWGDMGIDTSGRLQVYLDSVRLIQAFPLTGSGFGTFIHVFPSVQTIQGDVVFDHAHNDYIELLTDGGIIAFILCAWFVGGVILQTVRTLQLRRERYSVLVTSGALTGILALLFHSMADFQMYNGANALYFFFCCGLAVSAAHTRLQFRTRPTLLDSGRRRHLLIPGLVAVVLLGSSLLYTSNMYRARDLVRPFDALFLNRHMPQDRLQELHNRVNLAVELDPLEAGYPSRLGTVSFLLNRNMQAQGEFVRACRLQPTSGAYLQQLGLSLTGDTDARKESFLKLGIKREPLSLERYLAYCDWLLAGNRNEDAFSVLNQAMRTIPWKIPAISNFILARRLATGDIGVMLPPHPSAWHEIGRIMEQSGRLAEAESYYVRTLDFLQNNEILPVFFIRPYQLYLKRQQPEKALDMLRQGIWFLPDYAPFRILLGDYYLKQDIPYRAAQEYRQALRLDPDNRSAQVKLEQVEQN